ncbi:hypothetical protein D9V37_06825 [Nocardioides mangrovicus]|uniref:Uncharacterized protein n=1 Tax=Nocardioides mangrovicus TaxID=2478913 RepID=A0A3L8P3N0_9ACTN|nr:hypothetical protein [Nocardioides mangrovicus]RLV49627.1 hypothetical protein D9V37_06825 [Nocardioides mangrovicus]
MTSPEEMEQAADRLRACARTGREKAQALATQLDAVVTTSGDDGVWKGPYPTKATADLTADQQALGRAADLLRQDAAAWDRKADHLDADAADARAEAKKQAAARSAADQQPAGAH